MLIEEGSSSSREGHVVLLYSTANRDGPLSNEGNTVFIDEGLRIVTLI